MATRLGLILFICIFGWMQGICGETCYERNYWGGISKTIYCSGGCCGTSTNRYCCYDYYDYTNNNWNPVGAIIGGAVGGLLLVALVITCCVCICVKNKGRPGRIVAPTAGGPMVIMAQSHQQSDGYGYPPMSQYPYGTGQSLHSTNPGIASASAQGHMAPPPYATSFGGAYPVAGGDSKSTIPT